MITNAYTIFDTKALVFNVPFFSATDGAATRMCADLAGDPNTMVGRHPSDYVLYCIGSYDDAKGELLPLDIRRHVVDLIALVEPRPSN